MDDPPVLVHEPPVARIFHASDSPHALAADLRDLRYAAGNPTLQAISTSSGLSKSVLSSAFKGDHLPTVHTLTLLTRCLGDEPESWLARRETLREQAAQPPVTVPSAPFVGEARLRRSSRRRIPILVFAVSVGIVAILTVAGTTAFRLFSDGAGADSGSAAQVRQFSAPLAPSNGVDPLHTDCMSDAAVLSSAHRYGDSVLVEILSSAGCGAIWARASWFTPASAPSGAALSAELYREGAKYGGRARTAASSESTDAHTTMLIPEDGRTYCTTASIIMPNGSQVSLSPPLCS